MVAAPRLSHGISQLRQGAIQPCQADRTWSVAQPGLGPPNSLLFRIWTLAGSGPWIHKRSIRGIRAGGMRKEPANIAFRAQLVVSEHRQLYDYWLERAGSRTMPDRS